MKNVSRISCPKCGFKNDAEAKECFRCGIIFVKYEAMKQKKISKAGAEINKCKKCGSPIPKNTKDCPYCGVEVHKNLFNCRDCGAIISRNAVTCPVCGTKNQNILIKIGRSILLLGCGLIVLAILLPIIYGVFSSFSGGKQQKQKIERIAKQKSKETEEQKTKRIAKQKQERIQRDASRVNLPVQRYKDAVEKYGEPPSNGGVSLAKYYLKDHYLKDPDSLKIEKYIPLYLGAKGWHGYIEYRAKNSFGGYVRESKRFVVKHDKIISFQ